MPEVTVNIYSRSYRLAVSTGEEALIQRCADIVDKQMKAIREGGKVINQDQIAVLAALEVAYEANKNVQKNSTDAQHSAAEKDAEIARLKARIAELESRPALRHPCRPRGRTRRPRRQSSASAASASRPSTQT